MNLNLMQIVCDQEKSSINSERQFLHSKVKKPNPQSTLFIHTSEQSSQVSQFNTIKKATVRDVTISGMTLIFDADNDINHLCQRYQLANIETCVDLRTMTWCADTIIVRSPLYLHGTNLNIYARIFKFENDGCICTTPVQNKLNATTYDPADDGESGGNIKIFAKSIDTASKLRFILDGGIGQNPKEGEKGKDGKSVGVWNGDVFELIQTSRNLDPNVGTGSKINHYSGFAKQATKKNFSVNDMGRVQVLLHYKSTWGIDHGICAKYSNSSNLDSPVFPTNGEKSNRPAGRPGKGGDAGDFLSNLVIKEGTISQKGGQPGNPAPSTPGGNPGQPLKTTIDHLYYEDNSIWDRFLGPAICKLIKREHTEVHCTKPGPQTPSPISVSGHCKNPQAPTGKADAWVHPTIFLTALSYIKTIYLSGYYDEAENLLLEYINTAKPDKEEWHTSISSAKSQMQSLLNQLSHNKDFFGNSAGWEPLLPLPIIMDIYKQEVCSAIEVWCLSYWLNNMEELTEENVESVQSAIDKLYNEMQNEINTINSSNSKLIEYNRTLKMVQEKHAELEEKIKQLQEKLKNDATMGLKAKKFCYFLLHSASTVCTLIPWGQPALGIAGTGLDLLTCIDPDNPPESSDSVFELFENFIDVIVDGAPDKKVKEARESIKDLTSSSKDVKDKEKRKSTKKELKSNSDKISNVYEKLAPFFKDFKKQITNLKVSDSEIEKRLSQLEAQNKEYQELAKEIRELNNKKKQLVDVIGEIEQLLNDTIGTLTTNLNTSLSLCKKIDGELSLLDHTTFKYVNALADKQKEILNKYQYYLFKSYLSYVMPTSSDNFKCSSSILEYIDYQLSEMMDKVLAFVKDSTDGLLKIDRNNPESNKIYSLFTGIVQEITQKIIDDFINNPIRKDSQGYMTFYLTQNQIDTLNDSNSQQAVKVNLMDMLKLPINRERIRMVDFGIQEITFENSSEMATEGNIEIDFIYMGDGTIRYNGNLYAVRHPLNSENTRDSRPYWATNYDIAAKTLTAESPSSCDKAFISQFIKQPIENIEELINYRPPAWADFIIKRTDTGTDKPIKIKSLLVKFKLASTLTDATALNDKAIHILPKGEYSTKIECTPKDLNTQTDGWGSIFRMYHKDTSVKVEMPSDFAKYKFSHFEDPHGNIVSKDNSYSVPLKNNIELYYVYNYVK